MTERERATLVANMRHAFKGRTPSRIGGGVFYGEDMKAAAADLEAFPALLEALERARKQLVACGMESTAAAICDAAIEKAKG